MIRRREVILAAGLLLCPLSGLQAASARDADPLEWVVEISNAIISRIRDDAGLSGADPQKVRQFVDEMIMPVVDFTRMTRMAVGPGWRDATAEQRAELQDLFRERLIAVYSGALATVKDQTVKPASGRTQLPTESDAVARTLLVSPGKPDTHINYRLKKVKGEWRIIDVDVEGIWMVDNYRSQFASIVNASGIDGLIRSLREKGAGK